MSESAARETIQEEVYAVVDVDELVAHGLRDVVGFVSVARLRPVRLADEQDDARNDAHEERERRAQTQHGRVRHVTVVGAHGARAAHASARQRPDDRRVADGDGEERQRADEREGDPRSHVPLEVRELRRLPAVFNERASEVIVDGAARPEQVHVLGDGGGAHARAEEHGAARPEVTALLHREADGDEAVARERRQDPYRRVSRTVGEELGPLARLRALLARVVVEADAQPFGKYARHQNEVVRDRHRAEEDADGRVAQALATRHRHCEGVSGQTDDEQHGRRVQPDVAHEFVGGGAAIVIGVAAVVRRRCVRPVIASRTGVSTKRRCRRVKRHSCVLRQSSPQCSD